MENQTSTSEGSRREPVVVHSLRTDDFDWLAQAFSRWDHRFEQLSRGRFQGRIAFADLHDVQVLDCEVDQMLRGRGAAPKDSFVFSPILTTNVEAGWRGRKLRPGMINVLSPTQEMDHRTSKPYANTSLIVRRDLLERAAVGLIGVDFEACFNIRSPEIAPGLAEVLASRWRSTLRRIIRQDDQADGFGELAAIDLAAGLVHALAAGRIVDPVRTTPSQRMAVVRSIEALVRERPSERFSILTLCESAGVSERTLHYAFQEITGMSPKAYFKTLRLNLARREIVGGPSDRGWIGAVARKYGFLRPDHFAAHYRRLFGEPPSAMRISR